jgi:hypothetical protein
MRVLVDCAYQSVWGNAEITVYRSLWGKAEVAVDYCRGNKTLREKHSSGFNCRNFLVEHISKKRKP